MARTERVQHAAAAAPALLTPAEVASLFRVDAKTVTRWAQAGKIASVKTLGGHHRYREAEILQLLARNTAEATEPAHDWS